MRIFVHLRLTCANPHLTRSHLCRGGLGTEGQSKNNQPEIWKFTAKKKNLLFLVVFFIEVWIVLNKHDPYKSLYVTVL